MRKKIQEIVQQKLLQCRHDNAACALPCLVDCEELTDELRSSARHALASGFTLRHSFSHLDPQVHDDWLGGRWWLLHKSHGARSDTWSTLVCSRPDRSQSEFSRWPQRIEQAIRSLARDRHPLLIADGTMPQRYCGPLARVAPIECLRIRLPADRLSVAQWLTQSLDQIGRDESVAYATLWLSPAEFDATADFEALPLGDRAAMALAHRVMALSIRLGGNIANLLYRRLQDERFPIGTVSVALPRPAAHRDCDWLDRQAVGWYVPSSITIQRLACACRASTRDAQAVTRSSPVQWITDLRLIKSLDDYLVHCVRGRSLDNLCQGGNESIIDAIAHGCVSQTSPLQTLLTILDSGRLRASGKLLRSGAEAVSLADVPLNELMARRRFQPHLGRWDWEPYGLLLRRDALEQLGARPVIYGNDQTYEQLSDADRPFFQPARRRSAHSYEEHWQAEKEWRMLSDIHLTELPPGSVILFVATAAQAQQLAMHYAWPIIYLEANQTRWQPVERARRQRTSARTSRN